MRTLQPSHTLSKGTKITLWSLVLVCVVAAALAYTETHHITHFFVKGLSSIPTTPKEKEQATKNDPTTASGSAKSDAQRAPGVNKSLTTAQVPVSNSSSVTISTLDQSNGSINIIANITNPASSGVCTVTFTKTGAKPVTRTINTTTDICSSSIPELEFSMTGSWQAQVIYFANNTQASATGTITIQ